MTELTRIDDHKVCDLNAQITNSINFKWYEALWLPAWNIYCYPTVDQFKNIVKLASKLDSVKSRIGKPIIVTSWLRPREYNKAVGGSEYSAHMQGMAVDFQVLTKTADEVREIILPELDRLSLRMEKNPGSNWVHIDIREPGGSGRYFVP